MPSSYTTHIARKKIVVVVSSTLAYICGGAVVTFSLLTNAAVLEKYGGNSSLGPKVLPLKQRSAPISLSPFPV